MLSQKHVKILFDYHVSNGRTFAVEGGLVKPSDVNLYIHCTLNPMLARMRRDGELKKLPEDCKKTIKTFCNEFGSMEFQYTGEVNGVDEATGWGFATGHDRRMTGTFLNGLPEGIIIE